MTSPIKRYTAGDVKAQRVKANLSQSEYCKKYGLNLRTFQAWEQGARQPGPTACLLLMVIERFPEKAAAAAKATKQVVWTENDALFPMAA